MKRFLFLTIPLGLGVTAGWATATTPGAAAGRRFVDARHAATATDPGDHGESEPRVSADIVPEAVQVRAGGEALTLRVDVSSRLAGTPRFRTAVQIVDDQGHALRPAELSPVRKLEHAGANEGARVELPAGLADGFYQVHATVGAVSGKDEALGESTLFVEVAGGTVRLVDSDEFFIRSRANQGVKL